MAATTIAPVAALTGVASREAQAQAPASLRVQRFDGLGRGFAARLARPAAAKAAQAQSVRAKSSIRVRSYSLPPGNCKFFFSEALQWFWFLGALMAPDAPFPPLFIGNKNPVRGRSSSSPCNPDRATSRGGSFFHGGWWWSPNQKLHFNGRLVFGPFSLFWLRAVPKMERNRKCMEGR